MVNEQIAVIGDRDTITGLRMVGVHECFVPENSQEARERLLKYFRDPNTGLILITEPIAQNIEDTIMTLSEAPVPVILLIPDRNGVTGAHEAVLKELIRRAVGIEINI
jgi:V/A-type H+-transporting ATPase subunit F